MLNKDLSTEELAKVLEKMAAAAERLGNPLTLKRMAQLELRRLKTDFGIFKIFLPKYWLWLWKYWNA